jgi:uncharacterized protein YbgA (DUF1722 family)
LVDWARKRFVELEAENICGFIFKSDSPSSGMERVKVYNEKGMAVKTGIGIYDLKIWREVLGQKASRGNLVDFHTKQKLLILSHSLKHYQLMGKLVAKQKSFALQDLYNQYGTLLMDSLKLKTTPKKHTNILQHMMGYFKEQLSVDEKRELLGVIDNYQGGYIPLIVPVTLINHYVRRYDQPYLKEQIYLNPHPLELQLRNHV